MERELNNKNLREIHRLTIEVAKGNFAYKIPRTQFNDQIEALGVRLNMMAENLRENLSHISYVNPQKTYQHIHQTSFMLNQSLIITGFTQGATNLLEREEEEIMGKPFEDLLAEDSIITWKGIQDSMKNSELTSSSFQLEYVTGKNLLVPTKCSVSQFTMNKTSGWLITFFSTLLQNTEQVIISNNGTSKRRMSKWDIRALQNIHDYISHNFTKPPLTNFELAQLFDINEHRLKTGFKILFATTPFKFYNELRMQEAKTLIKNTDNTLELISFNLGFISYPHFSKAFKAHFGYSPRQFKKSANKNGDDK